VPQSVVLALLGGFDLRSGGQRVVLPPSAERVVAYLAIHRGAAARPKVAGTLWIDSPEDRAMANLRSALWRLRRPGVDIVETAGENLALRDEVEVDFRELTFAASRWLDGTSPADPSQLGRLARSRDLLGDWYDDWVLLEREHFRQLRLQALERLAVELADAGQFGRAIEAALAAVESEPLRESAHRALIAVHLAQGNRGEAIRQYCLYRRLMAEELSLLPSRQMDELIGTIPPAAMDRVMRR
jgi:DNA-binding SARP family transcriptional activator